MPDPTLAVLLATVTERLDHLPEPRREAEYLITAVLEITRAALHAFPERTVPAADAERLLALAERRVAGEPLAYITGRCDFRDLELQIDHRALVPRPETELLVDRALTHVPTGAPCRVADLGTGSGAVALAIAAERPDCTVVGTDISGAALAVAEANRAALGLANVGWLQGAWLASLTGPFHVIVANPPYIPAADPHLEGDGVRFEPAGALAAGPDGLDALRAIIASAPDALVSGGWLVVEHGHDQGDAVRALFAAAGFSSIATHGDLAGLERITEGRRADALTGG